MLDQLLGRLGQVVKRIGEVSGGRCITVTKAGIIRGDDMETVFQMRDEIPEHVGGGGKSVEENERGEMGLPRFPVEKVEPVDFDVVVCRHESEFWVRGQWNLNFTVSGGVRPGPVQSKAGWSERVVLFTP
jgi:hypothetical protein